MHAQRAEGGVNRPAIGAHEKGGDRRVNGVGNVIRLREGSAHYGVCLGTPASPLLVSFFSLGRGEAGILFHPQNTH